jgi:hypothetical protein
LFDEPFKVEERVLKQYVGLYKLNNKIGLAISYSNGQLYMKGEGKSTALKLPMLSESEINSSCVTSIPLLHF